MKHMDPASKAFTLLPRREQGRIYISMGWTPDAVAEELDVKPITVVAWLNVDVYERRCARKKVRRPAPRTSTKIPDAARETVLARRASGETLRAIAADYGVCLSTIYNVTRNLPKPPGGWQKGLPAVVDGATVAELRHMGQTFEAIGRRMRVSTSTAWKAYRRYLSTPVEEMRTAA